MAPEVIQVTDINTDPQQKLVLEQDLGSGWKQWSLRWGWLLGQHGPWIPPRPQVVIPTPGFSLPFGGNTGPELQQFRGMIGPWIRHGPQPQLWLWTLGLYVGPRGNMAHVCQHRPKLQWDHGPNMVLSSSQNLDITMAQKAARTTQIGLALVKFLE